MYIVDVHVYVCSEQEYNYVNCVNISCNCAWSIDVCLYVLVCYWCRPMFYLCFQGCFYVYLRCCFL